MGRETRIKLMNNHKIIIPIYFGYLQIVVAEDFVVAANKLNISDEGFKLNTLGAFVSTSDDDLGHECYTLFIQPDVDHDLIAHEVVHLVNEFYIKRGIKLDLYNDEPQAYLTGWITGEIYKVLKKMKIKKFKKRKNYKF